MKTAKHQQNYWYFDKRIRQDCVGQRQERGKEKLWKTLAFYGTIKLCKFNWLPGTKSLKTKSSKRRLKNAQNYY